MVTIELSDHEALVFFDLLSRKIDDNQGRWLAAVFDHPAEFWTLNAVQAALEPALSAPFAENYRKLLAEARDKVMDENDPDRSFGPIGGR
jgi:hypothetical protein